MHFSCCKKRNQHAVPANSDDSCQTLFPRLDRMDMPPLHRPLLSTCQPRLTMDPLTSVKQKSVFSLPSFLRFGSNAVTVPLEKGDKRLINAWTFYDVANSSYPMVITATIFPIFYENITSTRVDGRIVSDIVTLFGMSFRNTELYSYVAALSFMIVSITSPILSGIADASGSKKRFLQFYCYLGSFCCASLF